ncbi:hypothetical protein GCM10023225_13690 [Kineococcus glutinatus]|uniref:Uncharacterized protein n=1 Tax=Kineococcus glutinatus TaxID=1070872 RepID=A0ABP9HLF7_9ACTN
MHEHAAVGLDEQQPGGEGQVGAETSGVVDGAAGDDEAHAERVTSHRGSAVGSPACEVLGAHGDIAAGPLPGCNETTANRVYRVNRARPRRCGGDTTADRAR